MQQVTVSEKHTKNPKHCFTLIYLSSRGSRWHRRLPSSYEWVWTLTRVMDLIWGGSNTTRHRLVMSMTEPLQVNTELRLQRTSFFFLFCLKPFHWPSFNITGETKSVWTIAHFSVMWECVCVCVNHSAIWQHKPATSAPLICEIKDEKWCEITIMNYFSEERQSGNLHIMKIQAVYYTSRSFPRVKL